MGVRSLRYPEIVLKNGGGVDQIHTRAWKNKQAGWNEHGLIPGEKRVSIVVDSYRGSKVK